ncbi:MAG: hypothetical protein ACLRMJ_03095 [Alistipes finegoldii]
MTKSRRASTVSTPFHCRKCTRNPRQHRAARRLLPAYALAADGRIVTLNSAADAVPAGPAIDIDGMRTLTIDLNAMTYTLSRIAIANCMPDDGGRLPSKAFRTKDGGVKIWMTRNLNWNGGPEIGAMKLGSRLVPAYSGSATSGGYDPKTPTSSAIRLRRRGERRIGQGDQAVTDRHGRLYTLDEILRARPPADWAAASPRSNGLRPTMSVRHSSIPSARRSRRASSSPRR